MITVYKDFIGLPKISPIPHYSHWLSFFHYFILFLGWEHSKQILLSDKVEYCQFHVSP